MASSPTHGAAMPTLPLSKTGLPCSYQTVRNYVLRGVLIGGERVRLEAVRIGGRFFTSAEAVERFVARTNGMSRVAA